MSRQTVHITCCKEKDSLYSSTSDSDFSKDTYKNWSPVKLGTSSDSQGGNGYADNTKRKDTEAVISASPLGEALFDAQFGRFNPAPMDAIMDQRHKITRELRKNIATLETLKLQRDMIEVTKPF